MLPQIMRGCHVNVIDGEIENFPDESVSSGK
jgi:hypothetical protein